MPSRSTYDRQDRASSNGHKPGAPLPAAADVAPSALTCPRCWRSDARRLTEVELVVGLEVHPPTWACDRCLEDLDVYPEPFTHAEPTGRIRIARAIPATPAAPAAVLS